MSVHPDGKENVVKRGRRDADFPGLNPELAAADNGGESGSGRAEVPGSDAEQAAVGDGDGSRQVVGPRLDAEMAAELAVPDAEPRERRQADGPGNGRRSARHPAASDAGRATGLFALAIAIASLFVWALPLGLTAALLGWFSFREGARGLGVWAMVIGLIAALSQLVLIPIQAAWT